MVIFCLRISPRYFDDLCLPLMLPFGSLNSFLKFSVLKMYRAQNYEIARINSNSILTKIASGEFFDEGDDMSRYIYHFSLRKHGSEGKQLIPIQHYYYLLLNSFFYPTLLIIIFLSYIASKYPFAIIICAGG